MKKEIYPTMITPYNADGSVDYDGVKRIVDFYWKKGMDGIFAVCQSSEIFKLSLDERVKIAETVISRAKELGKKDKSRAPMKIVASGHISDDYAKQTEELNAIAATGADAVILITNRLDVENTSDEKWIDDLYKTVDALPQNIELGVYECPRPYKRLLTEKMLEAVGKMRRFGFIKDTVCDAQIIAKRCGILKPYNVRLYNANAQTFLDTLRSGAAGYCGIMTHFHPELYKWLADNLFHPMSEKVQAYLCLAAFTEYLAYPATAKWYLKEFEKVDILPLSRVVDCAEVTEYQKSCLRQMKLLGDSIKQELGI